MSKSFSVTIRSNQSSITEEWIIPPSKAKKVIELLNRPEFAPVNKESFATLTEFLQGEN